MFELFLIAASVFVVVLGTWFIAWVIEAAYRVGDELAHRKWLREYRKELAHMESLKARCLE